jgi:hypothetical protein
MIHKDSISRHAFVALPVLVLLGYGWFIVITYWPYLNAQLQLRSPDLAGLPEDVIGFGFWMWWPFIALLFTLALALALAAIERRGRVATILVSAFALLSVGDHYLCERLVEALLRG